jgi:hypothetical protein
MEAIDLLILSATDATRVISQLLSVNVDVGELREGVLTLMLPLIRSIINFCACNRALETSGDLLSPRAGSFAGLPATSFNEFGIEVVLTPTQALEGIISSLTSARPPTVENYGLKAAHVVHQSWEANGDLSQESCYGPVLNEFNIRDLIAIYSDALRQAHANEFEKDSHTLQWYLSERIRQLLTEDKYKKNQSTISWAHKWLNEILVKLQGKPINSGPAEALDMRLLWLHNNCVRLLHCLREHASPALGSQYLTKSTVLKGSDTSSSGGADSEATNNIIGVDNEPVQGRSEDGEISRAELLSNINGKLQFLPESIISGDNKSLNDVDGSFVTSVGNIDLPTMSRSSTRSSSIDIETDSHHYFALDELAYQLSTASFVDIKEFKQEFDALDSDNCGELNLEQFEALMQRININIASRFVPYIFGKFDKNDNGRISYAEIIADYSVPKKAFMEFVNLKYENIKHVRTLPLAIVYFFLFIYVSDWRELSGDMYSVTEAIKQRCFAQTDVYDEANGVVVSFDSIQSQSDFWFWFQEGLLMNFARDSDTGQVNVDNLYSIVVKDQISLRQDRKVLSDSCNAQYANELKLSCFESNTFSTETFGSDVKRCDNWMDADCYNGPDQPQLDSAFVSDPPQLKVDHVISVDVADMLASNYGTNFSLWNSIDELQTQALYLEYRDWFDNMTARVYIGLPLYNVVTGAWANMIYTVEIGHTGLFTTNAFYEVAVTGPYSDTRWQNWIPDIVWFCVLLSLMIVEIKSVVRHVQSDKLGICKRPIDEEKQPYGRAYFKHGWNYFDWCLMILVYTQSIFWLVTRTLPMF